MSRCGDVSVSAHNQSGYRTRAGYPACEAILTILTLPTLPDLARIPAGAFLMGAADAAADERPVHRVHVSEFFMGRFAVTNDEYARFVRATGHPAPSLRDLPLIATGGRDAIFKELSTPVRLGGPETAGRPRQPSGRAGAASRMRWRTAGGCPRRSSASSGCRPRRNGRRRRAAASKAAVIRGATRSTRRAATISRIRRPSVSAAHARPAPIRPTPSACATSRETCGNGCPTGTTASTTAAAT